jgi:hypothetical protein
VFSGYLFDVGFDMSNRMMFRLPLRDKRIARDSILQLSDQAVTFETIDRLFARFRDLICSTANCF